MKNREILVYLKKPDKQTYTWMFSFTVIFLLRHTREQQFQDSTEDPCKGRAIFFPSVINVWFVITHWTMAMCTAVPSPDGIPRQGWAFTYIVICLIFQAGKQKDISSVLSESASLWRFQFTPVTNLIHTVAFYGSFHGQSLFSWVVMYHKLL